MTQDVDLSVFRTLVPINGMKPESQKEIFAKVDTVLMDNGATLFKAGDQEPVSYYVVAGKVDLLTPDGEVMRTVKAETKESTYRLGHQFPRTCTARANGEITVVKFPNDLLDVALTWDQTGRFEVGELNDSDDDGSGDDWMTRVLQLPIFQKIPPANLQTLFMRMESVSVKVGEVIVRQGDDGDYFYVINQGRCIVTRESPSHDKPVKLAELGPGSVFGEEALISDDKRNATVTVRDAGTTLTRLAKDDFQSLMKGSLSATVSLDEAKTLAAEQKARLLDVRLPSEVAAQKVDGALNLPLYMLRMKLAALPTDVEYILCCDTGRRSAVAAFIMTQRGYNVRTLDGGLNKQLQS